MAVNPSAFGPKPQFELAAGTPAVGNRLFFYVAGSVGTKQNIYTDSTGATPNTNPVVLDSLGFPTATEIWWTAGLSYKVVYAPPGSDDPPNSPIWTVDNLRGINDTTSAFDQWIAGPIPTFINATSFSLVGDQTAIFTANRRIKTTNTSGTIYSTIISSVFAVVTTVTVVNDSGVLDSGLSAVSYGLISSVNTSAPALSKITNAIGADVLLNNTANYFDGPSVAQGTAGTWYASGTVTLIDTAGGGVYSVKLWDGTTVINSAVCQHPGASQFATCTISGFITSPVGNIRISVKDTVSTSGKIIFNSSGNSKDSNITAIRIG